MEPILLVIIFAFFFLYLMFGRGAGPQAGDTLLKTAISVLLFMAVLAGYSQGMLG